MPDNSSEIPENPDHINPQEKNPVRGMFDSWNVGKIDEPRDIAKEVRSEFPHDEIEVEEMPNMEHIDEKFGDTFLKLHHDLRRREEGEIAAWLESKDRKLSIYGEGGDFDEDMPGDPPLDWHPDTIIVTSSSPPGAKNKNERMHQKMFLGVELPEYFKDAKGGVNRVFNNYVYDVMEKKWHKDEEIIAISESAYIQKGRYDPHELEYVGDEKWKKVEDNHRFDRNPSHMPLDPNDYEQLQTILSEIRTGQFERDKSGDED